ncbi:MAG TPA: hypothetical protein VFU86_19275 [Terriglobales bacterium]|nr:hypothetical protein [Terriglobales bacterium]
MPRHRSGYSQHDCPKHDLAAGKDQSSVAYTMGQLGCAIHRKELIHAL